MRKIAEELKTAFSQEVKRRGLSEAVRRDFLKWLRYYLDFCSKYEHPPRDRESLQPFLLKLASKNQSREQQKEAASAVKLFHDLIQSWKENPACANLRNEDNRPWEAVYDQLKEEIRLRQYSDKTLKTYRTWIRQFAGYLNHKQPEAVDSEDAKKFLTHLATGRHVAASTQNQAFNALLFLYRHILKTDYDLKDEVVRAKKTKYIPVVLSRKEVDRVLRKLSYPHQLVAKLQYGCGLRLFEALNLRVQCVNLDEMILTVHDGRGRKDRTLPLPESIREELEAHLQRVIRLHEKDLESGYDGVFMPFALSRKWKQASKELPWQWLFAAKTLTLIPETGEYRRYHLHESHYQKAMKTAVRRAQLAKRVTSHTFRHSFATHLLQANFDIRTVQEMLGHSDVKTTMIYTRTLEARTLRQRKSPLDFPSSKIPGPDPKPAKPAAPYV